jgi:predicted metal-dependent hydrolase
MEDEQTILFEKGIEEFNQGEFFECHETLETFWRAQTEPEREFTQGIIQSAVAFYHLSRNNKVGAVKLFHRALPRLRKFEPVCMGLDVVPFADTLSEILRFLENSDGRENETGQELLKPPKIKAKNK